MSWRTPRGRSRNPHRSVRKSSKAWSEKDRLDFIRRAYNYGDYEMRQYAGDQYLGKPGRHESRVVFIGQNYESGKPLKLHPLEQLTGNSEHKGYFGVHVGDTEDWFPILLEDYGRGEENARVISIDTAGGVTIPDPNPSADTDQAGNSLPSSGILVFKNRVLPTSKFTEEPIPKDWPRSREELYQNEEDYEPDDAENGEVDWG